jgi:hypothetical protein
MMRVSIAPAEFRPVSVVLEDRDDFDKLMAIVAAVAENRIHHAPALIRAAVDMRAAILSATEGAE